MVWVRWGMMIVIAALSGGVAWAQGVETPAEPPTLTGRSVEYNLSDLRGAVRNFYLARKEGSREAAMASAARVNEIWQKLPAQSRRSVELAHPDASRRLTSLAKEYDIERNPIPDNAVGAPSLRYRDSYDVFGVYLWRVQSAAEIAAGAAAATLVYAQEVTGTTPDVNPIYDATFAPDVSAGSLATPAGPVSPWWQAADAPSISPSFFAPGPPDISPRSVAPDASGLPPRGQAPNAPSPSPGAEIN
jgi:hypothetical protein